MGERFIRYIIAHSRPDENDENNRRKEKYARK